MKQSSQFAQLCLFVSVTFHRVKLKVIHEYFKTNFYNQQNLFLVGADPKWIKFLACQHMSWFPPQTHSGIKSPTGTSLGMASMWFVILVHVQYICLMGCYGGYCLPQVAELLCVLFLSVCRWSLAALKLFIYYLNSFLYTLMIIHITWIVQCILPYHTGS